MIGKLTPIVEEARRRVSTLKERAGALEGEARARPAPPAWAAAFDGPNVAVIAEVKRQSPSAGAIAPIDDPADLAARYAAGGAVAVSVLTEERYFGGSMDDLRAVCDRIDRPVLRKDFIVDPTQILEARAAGASAVLLIARILTDGQLRTLLDAAAQWGLGVLLETHDAGEVERAVAAGAAVVGCNARDLDSFAVHLDRLAPLLSVLPPDVVAVAESGIAGADDVERVATWGADAVLVGTHAATHDDPEAAVRNLTTVSRRGRPT